MNASVENGFELGIERYIEASPAVVWRVWTEQLEQWWAPKPWKTSIIELDLRAGGRLAMMMSGPEGDTSPIEGIVLQVVPEKRVVFSDAFSAGWIPTTPFMVGIFSLEAEGTGTRYTAVARHWSEEAMKQHTEMGFNAGWSKVAEQLAQLAEGQ